MQCRVCGFENMQDQARCVRCQSQLTWKGPADPMDFYPPRSSPFKGLVTLAYPLNRLINSFPTRLLEQLRSSLFGNAILPLQSITAMIASAIPGLGHILNGRWRRALFMICGWIIFLILTINFYSGITGGLLIGLMIASHVWIILDAGEIKKHTVTVRESIRSTFFILLAVTIAYWSVDRTVHRYIDLATSPFKIQTLGIQQGDILLVRRNIPFASVKRDDVVLIKFSGVNTFHLEDETLLNLQLPRIVTARVVALQGDKIETSHGKLLVNGDVVDVSNQPDSLIPFPVEEFTRTVPNDCLVALFPVLLEGIPDRDHAVSLVWENCFFVKSANLDGKAIGVYAPIRRRCFF
ncbi:MAG: S26 family signal peptidase [Pseudomonadota bacterium]